MVIREITIQDAEKFAHLTKEIEDHSDFMLWEPGERAFNIDQQRKRIEAIQRAANSALFAAEENNELVGFLMAIGGTANREKHTVYIVIGILKEYRGQGVGTRLFNELEQWSIEKNIHRLELTVVDRNLAGISLYKKMGFEIEGTKRESLFINGEFVDQYYMSRIL